MSAIDVKLSDIADDAGIFHDLRYTNDRENGNGNKSMLEINNVSGNEIFVEGCFHQKNEKTGEWSRVWYDLANGQGLDGIRIHITGGIENGEFLQMLQLILRAEEMVDIIKP